MSILHCTRLQIPRFRTREDIDADLERAAQRKVRCKYGCAASTVIDSLIQAAIDENRSALAATEVAHAKAVAAEHRALEGNETAPQNGKTAQDVQRELDLAAERKKKIDADRAAKAGADYQHVG